jgi:hypothetical protein
MNTLNMPHKMSARARRNLDKERRPTTTAPRKPQEKKLVGNKTWIHTVGKPIEGSNGKNNALHEVL